VFLDRDGVLNAAVIREGRPYPPSRAEDVVVLPGVREACEQLRAGGFELVVVTNQPDVARGTQTLEAVHRIHVVLAGVLAVDEFVVCPHDDADACACRKPKPGMLVDAAQRRGIDLEASYMVGDRWRDVEAGKNAGCRTLFIDRSYREKQPEAPDQTVQDLREAAFWILRDCDT
jgi:D-glycero-D-manno-heptose 1,7-bisphosphate phosphatase